MQKIEEIIYQSAKGLIWGIVICGIISLFFGCRSVKYVPVYVNNNDSTYTETHTRIDYVKDTLWYTIPEHKAESTARDSSHLENDFAVSDARIMPDGTLHHTLETKPQEKPIEFDKPVESKDSVVYKYKTRTDIMTVEVEKRLTWWQKFRLEAFWWLLGTLGVVGVLAVIMIRKIQKKIALYRGKS